MTAIKLTRNKSNLNVDVENIENPNDTHGTTTIPPYGEFVGGMGIPWYSGDDFYGHIIRFHVKQPNGKDLYVAIYEKDGLIWCCKGVGGAGNVDTDSPYIIEGQAAVGADRTINVEYKAADNLILTLL